MSKWPQIRIYQCPVHEGFVTLVVDEKESGARVLGGKCCPKQYAKTIHAWVLTQAVRDELVTAMDAALKREVGDE